MKRALTLLFIFLLLFSPPLPSYPGEKGYETAETCKRCHGKIYDQWKSSRHANAFTEPTFSGIYREITANNPDTVSLCRFCHSPLAGIPKKMIGKEVADEEGVSCDFCHTVKEVRLDGNFPKYINTPGTKRGPIDDAKSPYHETEFSPLLLDAKFCAGCHEFTNQKGVPILTTYAEWEKSFYRGEGIHCQFCHLPQLFPGSDKSDAPPDHTMRGGHFPDKIREAVRMSGTLRSLKKKALIEIELFNDKSGHKVPTGIPTRKFVVDAQLFGDRGRVIGKKQLLIERVLGDKEGNPITSAAEMFLNASTVLKDNRIGPKEKRKLTIDFPLKNRFETLSAIVSLLYEVPSPDPHLKKVRMNIDTITIPQSSGKFPFQIIIALLLLITAGLIVYDIVLRKKTKKSS